jgi:hypothetical protein
MEPAAPVQGETPTAGGDFELRKRYIGLLAGPALFFLVILWPMGTGRRFPCPPWLRQPPRFPPRPAPPWGHGDCPEASLSQRPAPFLF